MLKLLTAQQMREADAYTIASKGISSIDLMEAASKAFVALFKEEYPDRNLSIAVYCGTGNNGGDGLAIARLLYSAGYNSVQVVIARFSERTTGDFEINYRRLAQLPGLALRELKSASDIQEEPASVIIDALLGSGLNKPLSDQWKELVAWLNRQEKTVIAVDVPAGLPSEGPVNKEDTVLKADLAISFQRPKINFLLPDSASHVRDFRVADIGLDEAFIQKCGGPYYLTEESDVRSRLKARERFSHKGTFGHALLVAGAPETMGAALLASRACLNAGAGLTTACIPSSGLTALNTAAPEIMALLREEPFLQGSVDWGRYQAVGVGPGLGTGRSGLAALEAVLKSFQKAVVFDADALNLLAANYELMQQVPEGSVFTPHLKEFDRLFGKHSNWWSRIETGIDRAATLGCTIVLKNRYTIVFTPEGSCFFNPTGGPSMSTGGMGDVLTGVITSFIAQGYEPAAAALLGVYVHGAAGDTLRGYVVSPSRLIDELPLTMERLASA